MKYKTVLFDLDGTVSQSGIGVRDGIEDVLKKMNKPVPDLSDFSLYIGPPLIDTFQKLGGLSEQDAHTAIGLFRKYYMETGKYKNEIFPSIRGLLIHLRNNGVCTGIATTKTESFAKWVIEFIGLTDLLDTISGVPDDYSIKEKHEVIERALQNIPGSSIDTTVLVGDSMYDVKGASIVGCDFIGVTYGYGKREQMEQAGATVFVDSARELYKML